MLTKIKSNRLGEILVRKGIITHEQLKVAIQEQSHRRKISHIDQAQSSQSSCLGEILTELGFVDRKQLKRGLNWQLVLRKITMALALCAPLLGSGFAKAATTTSKAIVSVPATIQAEDFSASKGVVNQTTTDSGGGLNASSIGAGDWMNYITSPVNIPATGEYIVSYRVSSLNGGGSFLFVNVGAAITKIDRIAVPKTGAWQTWVTIQRKVTLKAGPHYFGIQSVVGGFNINWFKITSVASTSTKPASSTAATVSSIPSSKSSAASSKSSSSVASVKSSAASSKVSSVATSSKAAVSSSKSSAKSSSSSSSLPAGYNHLEGPVGLSWIAPKQREDKSILDIVELGGYQIRYKKIADSKYTTVVINDAWTTTYNFTVTEGDYIVQIAAFDKLGILSDFSSFQ